MSDSTPMPPDPPKRGIPHIPFKSSPEWKEHLEATFNAALEQPATERADFLADACGSDTAFHERVRRLLAAHEKAGLFLEAVGPEVESELARLLPEEAGNRIGSYRLIEQIGEGGFGVVWMAEQERPVKRLVALKIIKLGMDTREVIARFKQERQALAMMDHPNIAKVFDAGATVHGRPYFVMELVRGSWITDYCDKQSMSIQKRLDLFIDVCQAVQHAHQKGIIHRDLKPSNILVTVQDGEPIPKVIDFGVAKAIQQQLTALTIHTKLDQMIGTPPYMSPEQAESADQNVDTRTDVYALGVLLYELLTGRTPLDTRSLITAGYDAMRRMIIEQEPSKPSTALAGMAVGISRDAAQRRQSDVHKLISITQGDLDWIAMKALEKDRNRRYETANGLAVDVQRYLQCEPVRARPPSGMYRFGRLVRRHRIVFGTVGAVAAALILGLSVALVSLFKEKAALAAEAEQRRLAVERGEQAKANELTAQRFRYAADMISAQEALRVGNIGRARRLLDQHRNANPDLRGWEWRYLWQQCQSGAIARITKHAARVLSLSFSPDGNLLAVAFSDGRIEIWNLTTRDLEKVFTTGVRINGARGVGLIRFGSNGILAQASPTGMDLYDLVSGTPKISVPLGSSVQAFAFVNDGSHIICRVGRSSGDLTPAAELPTLKFIDAQHRAAIESGPQDFTVLNSAGNVRYDSKGRRQFVSAQSGMELSVRVIQQSGTGPQHVLPIGTDNYLYSIDLSPDGATLVIGTGWERSVVQVWDTSTLKLTTQLPTHSAWISETTFSPDGSTLATASADQTVRLWNTKTWQEIAILRGHENEIWTAAFSPDGKLLASGAKDGEVLLWNVEHPPNAGGRFDFPEEIRAAWPIPGEGLIITQARSDKLTAWSLPLLVKHDLPDETIHAIGSLNPPTASGRTSLNGRFHAANSEAGVVRLQDSEMKRELTLQGHFLAVDGVAFSSDNNRLVTTSGGREAAKIWDTETGQELLNLSGRGMNLYFVDFLNNDDALLVGSTAPGYWQLWRAPSWEEIHDAELSAGKWPSTEQRSWAPPSPTSADVASRIDQARSKSPESFSVLQRPRVTLQQIAFTFEKLHKNPADNSKILRDAGVLWAWLGKTDNYLAMCRQALRFAENSRMPIDAERAINLCSLRPSTDAELLKAALQLEPLAKERRSLPLYQMTLGMAEYRQQKHSAADRFFQAAAQADPDDPNLKFVPGISEIYRAMSLLKQGNQAAARELFNRVESNMVPLPANEQNVPADMAGPDQLVLWLAYKEAKAMFQEGEK
jgi:serine/threonine protein kinase/WD40 repeat protein